MSTRPEALFPLFGRLETLPGVGKKTAQLFPALGIEAPVDLLHLLPVSGIERTRVDSIQGLATGATVALEVDVIGHRPPPRKGRPYQIEVRDAATTFFLVFFHARTAYLEEVLPTGSRRAVSGKIEYFEGIGQMAHPDMIGAPQDLDALEAYEPIYPLTAGLTQKAVARAAEAARALCPDIAEWADAQLVAERGWPGWRGALEAAHRPVSDRDLSPGTAARQRLAYDELFAHQMTLALARSRERAQPGVASQPTGLRQAKALAALPYTPTGAQTRAIAQITADLSAPRRMSRLLQGDVGSGKTLVALMAMLAAVEAGGQAVLMAPTEILARQHLEGLQPLAEAAGVVLELLTGRDKGKERASKLAALAAGNIQILVGTHAVFQNDVHFADLRLAIIDEQHRFGVQQRQLLGAKNTAVDMLVMTATPIPRSLALAEYGDMDVSVLDEKPPGRTPVTTALVPTARLDTVVENLRRAVAEGRQAYWVCPLVGESETVDLTSAEARFAHLRAALGDSHVGLVHGQMPGPEKDATMARFQRGEIAVLVATTVIEVGVNVPNASIMVIERAETFGLAQLHQLRGRVGRGAARSTCVMLYQAPLSVTGEKRLRILRESEDGFFIAEQDLQMRGAGDVIGTAQSGLPRFRVADLETHGDLMQIAQTDARALLVTDPKLQSPRGHAVRMLLWLLRQERAFRLISVG